MSLSSVILFILSALTWLLMTVSIMGFAGVEAHGDAAFGVGLSFFAAIVFTCLLWLWMGGLALTAAGEGILPNWVGPAATLLLPASGAAALATFYLVEGAAPRWPIAVPIGAPILIAGYLVLVRVPSLRPSVSANAVSIAVWALVAALAILPWPGVVGKMQSKTLAREEGIKAQQEYQKQADARTRAENLEKIKAMTPDKHIVDWYPLLDPKNGTRAEALEALRKMDRRQGDIQEMLGYGIPAGMGLVPDLDLKPTPELCEAAKAFLAKEAKSRRHRAIQDPSAFEAVSYDGATLEGVRWFATHGCDLKDGLEALKASILTHLDSADRRKYIATLDEIAQIKAGQ